MAHGRRAPERGGRGPVGTAAAGGRGGRGRHDRHRGEGPLRRGPMGGFRRVRPDHRGDLRTDRAGLHDGLRRAATDQLRAWRLRHVRRVRRILRRPAARPLRLPPEQSGARDGRDPGRVGPHLHFDRAVDRADRLSAVSSRCRTGAADLRHRRVVLPGADLSRHVRFRGQVLSLARLGTRELRRVRLPSPARRRAGDRAGSVVHGRRSI